MSRHKIIVRFAEYTALVGSALVLCVAAAVHLRWFAAARVEPLVYVALFAVVFSFGAAVVLASEFANALRAGMSWRERSEGLSSNEISALLRWSPPFHKFAAVAGVCIGVLTALIVGEVELSSGQPFTEREAIGSMLYVSVFLLLALPVLASASRMPGTYEDNFTPVLQSGT